MSSLGKSEADPRTLGTPLATAVSAPGWSLLQATPYLVKMGFLTPTQRGCRLTLTAVSGMLATPPTPPHPTLLSNSSPPSCGTQQDPGMHLRDKGSLYEDRHSHTRGTRRRDNKTRLQRPHRQAAPTSNKNSLPLLRRPSLSQSGVL